MKAACDAFGLTFGVWEAEPQPGTGAAAVWATGAEHYIAQAETPRDWPSIVSDFRQAYAEPFPAAVVTTFGGIGATPTGYDPSVSKPVIDASFRCLTEAYQNADPGSTPDNTVWTATEKLGWPHAQPTIGVWGDYPAESYFAELRHHPGYWVWLAETMTERDWSALRELNLSLNG